MSEMPDWFTQMLTEATMTGEHEAAWTKFNRWAAFTTDELESLDYELGERARNPLLDEIVAELERRET